MLQYIRHASGQNVRPDPLLDIAHTDKRTPGGGATTNREIDSALPAYSQEMSDVSVDIATSTTTSQCANRPAQTNQI